MAHSFLDPSAIRDWIDAIRFDFSSPTGFAWSIAEWLGQAPMAIVLAGSVVLVAAMGFSRRPGAAALVVVSAAALLIAAGWLG